MHYGAGASAAKTPADCGERPPTVVGGAIIRKAPTERRSHRLVCQRRRVTIEVESGTDNPSRKQMP
jgi:hypothetical protein